jgi:hypothetical protein
MQKKNNLAPVCLFTYNRLNETVRTVEALKNNRLAPETDLWVFSDGPKSEDSKALVANVRAYLSKISGFKTVELIESKENMGLAKSIISGVSFVMSKYGSVIVLEDDLLTSTNFLDFMNQALVYYKDDPEVISISGYTLDLPSLPGSLDYYFGYRASSWGWGTWEDRWDTIDWEVKDYNQFINDSKRKALFKRGGSDLVGMLRNQMEGRIDSWAIRFCYTQFNQGLKTVYPTVSKVNSIGFSGDATHTKFSSRFKVELDPGKRRTFRFEKFNHIDEQISLEFRNMFSYFNRGLDRLRGIFK